MRYCTCIWDHRNMYLGPNSEMTEIFLYLGPQINTVHRVYLGPKFPEYLIGTSLFCSTGRFQKGSLSKILVALVLYILIIYPHLFLSGCSFGFYPDPKHSVSIRYSVSVFIRWSTRTSCRRSTTGFYPVTE